jgi:hypothetical protein
LDNRVYAGMPLSAMREVYHWGDAQSSARFNHPTVTGINPRTQFGTCAEPASLVVSVVGLQSYHSNLATAVNQQWDRGNTRLRRLTRRTQQCGA